MARPGSILDAERSRGKARSAENREQSRRIAGLVFDRPILFSALCSLLSAFLLSGFQSLEEARLNPPTG
jgi:hypothetical protein